MKRWKFKGFTLVELIVCVAILAILAMLAIPQYQKAKLSAIVSAHNSDVQTIKSAAMICDMETGDVDDIAKYLEGGEMPDVAKEVPGDEFDVSKVDNSIVVTPGLVELDGNEIKLVSASTDDG